MSTDHSDPHTWDRMFTPLEDPGSDQRWSTWNDVEKGCRGPEPRPDWVVTAHAAIDTDFGVLKTGKEADVFLLERAVPGDQGPLLAAKRYRTDDHRTFHRSAVYTEGRGTRRSRDARALSHRSSKYGRSMAASTWAAAEFTALCTLWSAGVPVPYPVQIDGTEILMEYISDTDGAAAPRLAQLRPDRELLEVYADQMRTAMMLMARSGVAHGDLSPYNVLATDERVVIIDVPQVVDIVSNPQGVDFLMRDCRTMCGWFVSRGLDIDENVVFADVIGSAFGGPPLTSG